jgi:hypothetical protein
MSPYLYEPFVKDHQRGAMTRAELARLRKADAGDMANNRRSLRDSVGFGLIALGVRLVDHPVAAIEDLDQAA